MKKDFYCLELKIKNKEISEEFFHSHLYISTDNIEIKVYIDSTKNIDRMFMIWSSSNDISDFIKDLIEIKISEKENVLEKIDITNSKIKLIKSVETENNNEFFTISLDQILVHKKYIFDDNIGISKVYLNHDGFDLVKSFYSIFSMSASEGNFEISRMDGMHSYYKIGKIKFRPEFEYKYYDSKNNKEFKAEKIPILKFIFPESIDEKTLIEHINIVCNLTSFYLGNLIDYHRIIAFKPNTILSLTKIIQESSGLKVNSINYYLNIQGIHSFLNSNWAESYLSNHKKINKAIENYLHSRFVDTNLKFLLLYNIVEIFMSGKSTSNEKFKVIVSDSEKEMLYENALNELKKTISEKDHSDFVIKWNALKNKIQFKPMKSPLVQFLKDNNIEDNDLINNIDAIKEIRDKITHGSVKSLKSKVIEECNYDLYSISIKLILNQLGLNNLWYSK